MLFLALRRKQDLYKCLRSIDFSALIGGLHSELEGNEVAEEDAVWRVRRCTSTAREQEISAEPPPYTMALSRTRLRATQRASCRLRLTSSRIILLPPRTKMVTARLLGQFSITSMRSFVVPNASSRTTPALHAMSFVTQLAGYRTGSAYALYCGHAAMRLPRHFKVDSTEGPMLSYVALVSQPVYSQGTMYSSSSRRWPAGDVGHACLPSLSGASSEKRGTMRAPVAMASSSSSTPPTQRTAGKSLAISKWLASSSKPLHLTLARKAANIAALAPCHQSSLQQPQQRRSKTQVEPKEENVDTSTVEEGEVSAVKANK